MEHRSPLAFLVALSNRDQHVISASYLILCKAEPSKCFTFSSLFDLGMHFVPINNLLTERVDYTFIILELFGEKN